MALAGAIMSYWGNKPDECDFAFDSVGANIYIIKERLLKDIEVVAKNRYSEQSIIANLVCLRVIGERFPKALSVHFRKRDFEMVKAAFYKWYETTNHVPAGLKECADSEFSLFEQSILKIINNDYTS